MKQGTLIPTLVAGLLLAVAAPMSAQQQPARELVVLAQNLTAQQDSIAGKPRADGGKIAEAGDVVEYRLVFTNTRDIPLSNVVFSDPVPMGLTFVAASVKSSREDVAVEYSIDKGQTWSARPKI
jgi:uncharacterized repeat protein (TIGR01451 family)